MIHVGLCLAVYVLLPGADPATGARPPVALYEPTWESLDRHATPTWLMDAKLGLFIYPPHPTEADWEAHRQRRGLAAAAYPGPDRPWTRGTRDQAGWDPDDLAQLAVDMGARYIVWGVDPIAVFLTYPSRHADVPGSTFSRLGPADRDYVGEVAQAARARGLRFGLHRNYLHPEEHPRFLEQMQEMIDRYRPAMLWLDGPDPALSAEVLRSRELLAYYYSHAPEPEEVACEDALGDDGRASAGQALVHGDWYRKEAARAPAADAISQGYYVRFEAFHVADWRTCGTRTGGIVDNYLQWLVHCAAHNGNLQIAIWCSPRSLYERQKPLLRQIGDWLRINGDAIYGTRPWFEGRAATRTAEALDVRFTTKDEALYAIVFDWPGELMTIPHLEVASDRTTVQLLGRMAPTADLPWEQVAEGLRIRVPRAGREGSRPDWPAAAVEIPCDHAFCFKITPRPRWAP